MTDEQKKVLFDAVLDKDIEKKLYEMGSVNDPTSGVYKFFYEKNLDAVGLESLREMLPTKIIKDFVQFIWGEIGSYRTNEGLKRDDFQTFSSNRITATKIMADLIGLSYLIPDVKMCIIQLDDGKQRIGSIMKEAQGVSPSSFTKEQRMKVSPEFQRACSDLNVLDALNHEKDHRPGNYNVIVDERGNVKGLQAFDNDCPQTFFLTSNISLVTYWESSPLLDKNGELSLPYMSLRLAERIKSLSHDEVTHAFKDNLSGVQVFFLWKRICNMKLAIDKTYRTHSDFLLNDNQWNSDTLNHELGMKNYNGYLNIFCNSMHSEIDYANS